MPELTPTQASYITISEAADLLRVSQRTVYRWVKEGEIPCFRLGNVTRIAQQDLSAFIKRHSDSGATDGPSGG